MSYDLRIRATRAPDVRAVRAGVDTPDLRARPALPDAGPWPEGTVHVHRHGVSTRATTVTWTEGVWQVEIRALAAPEDCALALGLARAAAADLDAPVETEHFGTVAGDTLAALHDADWMAAQAASGVRALEALIAQGRGPMQAPGPLRSFYVGTRVLAALAAAGPADQIGERMIAAMRKVQWGLPPEARDAGVFESGDDGAGRVRFAVWLPDEPLVFAPVNYVVLNASAQEVVAVPFGALPELAGERAALIDECQLLVAPVATADWPALVARARRHAVERMVPPHRAE